MKTIPCFLAWIRFAALVLLPSVVAMRTYAAPTAVQTITLKPGWNAISTTVVPADPDLDAVFQGVDVDSVWAYENRTGSPDFIQEISEQSLASAGWNSWVPAGRTNAFQNDLFALRVNHAYLVKLAGSNDVSLTLSGRPSLRLPAWKSDSYNFRGFPVDPAFPPAFLAFFRPSAAHYSTTGGLQPMYRLDSLGAWVRVQPSDLMNSGEAYWVYCRGGSEYVAPLSASTEIGDGLDFGAAVDEYGLEFQNNGSATVNATVRDLSAPAASPLVHAERLADATLTWPALPEPLVRAIGAGAARNERLAVRRALLTADLFETVLEVTDGIGSRLLVPVSAERAVSASLAFGSSGAGPQAKAGPGGKSLEAISHAGLWYGTITLNAVSEAHSGALTTNYSQGFTVTLTTNADLTVTTSRVPNSVARTNVSLATTPTGTDFRLRLLLHVDAGGQSRLLKEVIQMWQDGTTTNDVDGFAVAATSGRTILVTDESKVGQFTGVTARDGVIVGRRLSTAGFDFADNELPLAGDFSEGSSVTGTNLMSASFARNPFKHRFHPDHAQGLDIKRVIELTLSSAPTNAPPGYGERVLDGVYRETISGLHRTSIAVSGTFRINRVATTAVLNE